MNQLIEFVSAIQEFERAHVPELKTGREIGRTYATWLIKNVSCHDGVILMANQDNKKIGLVCAWIDKDEDQLLQEQFSVHAYVSDIFVLEFYRNRGIAHLLLERVEKIMFDRGCARIRVRSKATNLAALKLYEHSGYQPYETIFTKVIRAQGSW